MNSEHRKHIDPWRVFTAHPGLYRLLVLGPVLAIVCVLLDARRRCRSPGALSRALLLLLALQLVGMYAWRPRRSNAIVH